MYDSVYQFLGLPQPDGIDPNAYQWERVWDRVKLTQFAREHAVVRDVRVFTEEPKTWRYTGEDYIDLGHATSFKNLVEGVEFDNGQVLVAVGTEEGNSMSSQRDYHVGYYLLTPRVAPTAPGA